MVKGSSLEFETWFKDHCPEIPLRSASAVLRLTAEGATLPFIARYRKEQTGNLDELGIKAVLDLKEKWDTLTERQAFIVSQIDKQGKLTSELKEKILSTFSQETLEDLYLPYKQKKTTKAARALEAGLGPLADWIWNCGHGTETPQPGQTLELWAFTFKNEEKGFPGAKEAIQGAQDILVERLSEMPLLRKKMREAVFGTSHLRSKKAAKAKPNSKFENYFDYHEAVKSLLQPQNSHRYLAIRRGWMEEELTLSFDQPELLKEFETEACSQPDSAGAPILLKAAELAFKNVFLSIENEAHRGLKEVADIVAIRVFAENVRKLLLAAPLGSKAVLGVDPGIRTGCKVVVVNDSGKFIANTVVHLKSEDEKAKAKALIPEIVKVGGISAIAVGNGTGGRETEAFIRSALKEAGLSVSVVIVNEAGASVYSASDLAREEFPDLDVTVRGAISIARRLQDPLAELVKIDPKSIGVGQYQHDVAPHHLKKELEHVVDSCVNQVGVNLNTSSPHLLAHVAGIGSALAAAIVEHRDKKGRFCSRTELLDVPRFSARVFEQAAGFLRIPDSEHPLDNTGVHPERYATLEGLASRIGKNVADFLGPGAKLLKESQGFKEELGAFTFDDIVRELEKPGRDPRDEFTPFQYRDDIFEIKDLKPGMICPGIVTNVTNFGAFVDIGVHQDGLVHVSQLSEKFVKDPREVVSPGDHVKVRVLEANIEKKQISLSMKAVVEVPKPLPRPKIPAKAPIKRPGHPSRKPKEAFNNPFAQLASLKQQLKSGR